MQTASEADVAQGCARGVLVPLHPNLRRHSTLARPPEHLLPSTQAGHPKPAVHPWPTARRTSTSLRSSLRNGLYRSPRHRVLVLDGRERPLAPRARSRDSRWSRASYTPLDQSPISVAEAR